MEDKYKKWDGFIAQLILCQAAAQKKYNNFFIMDIYTNDVYDYIFHRTAMYANQFTKCKIYCYPYNIFKFLIFKRKERQAHYPSYRARRQINSVKSHLCTRAERVQLIEELAESFEINPEDLTSLYKEYYSK